MCKPTGFALKDSQSGTQLAPCLFISLAGGLLPYMYIPYMYMGRIGMYRCEGYGFQAVYSRIGYINQSVWV